MGAHSKEETKKDVRLWLLPLSHVLYMNSSLFPEGWVWQESVQRQPTVWTGVVFWAGGGIFHNTTSLALGTDESYGYRGIFLECLSSAGFEIAWRLTSSPPIHFHGTVLKADETFPLPLHPLLQWQKYR